MNNQDAIEIAVFVLVILGLVLFFLIHRQNSQNEIRRALIERFGAAQDLGAFLQSDGGQRFLAGLSTGISSPLGSVLGAVQKGIILVLLGLGCLLASLALDSMVVASVGLVLGCLGVGFLVSALVTHQMSKKWGLIEKPPGDAQPRDSGN